MRKKVYVRSHIRRTKKGEKVKVRSHWRMIEEKLGKYKPTYFYGKKSSAKIEVIKMGNKWYVNVGKQVVGNEGTLDLYVVSSKPFSNRRNAIK